MNRREVLTSIGATAAGLAVGTAVQAHDEGKKPDYLAPVQNLHAYLCAFHIGKANPDFVVEAHHYCSPVGDSGEVHQCVIYDKNTKNARILGVEYIISDRLYRQLPEEEKKYYHVHTYEIISGMLIAPGLPRPTEKDLMEGLLTTWGKTWHTWPDPKTALPIGPPMLMWSATKDGQISPQLLAQRDQEFKVNTDQIRKSRAYLGPCPQIDPPANIDSLGRQWTNSGPDVRPKS